MEQKGFFGSLFDLSFTEFVTTRIIKFLYVLGIIGAAIAAISFIIGGMSSDSGAAGVLSLVFAPLLFILYVMGIRVWLEVIIVVFRIAENTGRLVEQGGGSPSQEVEGPTM
jgi:hypothetical protein